ncbi:hypothetical protein [Acetivibrio ethanolgignens]|uniref:Uncharacterized protein n=1 Tax=Acetivibrio ethanolgignens TaxID=290052 RepID=A0A0V8QDC4_9FIRM|nr:hypothetical protein [Acetivibrio ethanolgignens]KSV58562.1 hypothetical protein ASU35_12425 [Acetivibrio ethanolgignens]
MKMLIKEMKKNIAEYKKHWLQYSLFAVTLISLFIYGLLWQKNESQVSSYERMTAFYIIYYLVIVRFFSACFVNVYNEFHQSYYLNGVLCNESLGKYDALYIIMVRVAIKSIFSIGITFLGTVGISIVLGVGFSPSNYGILLLRMLVGCIMTWGIGLIFCSICMLFNIQKSIALFGEIILLCYMIMVPLDNSMIPINLIKSSIYEILFKDIILCEKGSIIRGEDAVILICSIIIIATSIIGYRFLEWIKIRKVRYEK